jgi:hypothetical protein
MRKLKATPDDVNIIIHLIIVVSSSRSAGPLGKELLVAYRANEHLRCLQSSAVTTEAANYRRNSGAQHFKRKQYPFQRPSKRLPRPAN